MDHEHSKKRTLPRLELAQGAESRRLASPNADLLLCHRVDRRDPRLKRLSDVAVRAIEQLVEEPSQPPVGKALGETSIDQESHTCRAVSDEDGVAELFGREGLEVNTRQKTLLQPHQLSQQPIGDRRCGDDEEAAPPELIDKIQQVLDHLQTATAALPPQIQIVDDQEGSGRKACERFARVIVRAQCSSKMILEDCEIGRCPRRR